jgi:hypothetical protein
VGKPSVRLDRSDGGDAADGRIDAAIGKTEAGGGTRYAVNGMLQAATTSAVTLAALATTTTTAAAAAAGRDDDCAGLSRSVCVAIAGPASAAARRTMRYRQGLSSGNGS